MNKVVPVIRKPSKTGKPVGGQPKYQTPEALAKGVEAYFATTGVQPVLYKGKPLLNANGNPVTKDVPPTVTGLALFLGFCDRRSMYDYKLRTEFSHVIKNATTRIEMHHEEALSNRDRCTGNIFFLKNHDWHDDRSSMRLNTDGKGALSFEISFMEPSDDSN